MLKLDHPSQKFTYAIQCLFGLLLNVYLSGKVIKGRINDNRYQTCNHGAPLEFTILSKVSREKKNSKMRKLCLVLSKPVPTIGCIRKVKLSKNQNMILWKIFSKRKIETLEAHGGSQ